MTVELALGTDTGRRGQPITPSNIVRVVDQAISDGKIAAASRDYYLALCRTNGLHQFERAMASLPALTKQASVAAFNQDSGRAAAAAKLSDTETARAALRYQKQLADAGREIDFAAAVQAVRAGHLTAGPVLPPKINRNASGRPSDPEELTAAALLHQKQLADIGIAIDIARAVNEVLGGAR